MAELGVHGSALLTDLALCVNRWRLFSPGWYVCVLTKVQLDVFDSKDDPDFLRRRDRFCKFGVQEYVAFLNDEPVGLLRHRLEAGYYRLVEPDEDGIIRSEALPNFWAPLKALQDRDCWAVLGCIERGVSRRANFN